MSNDHQGDLYNNVLQKYSLENYIYTNTPCI